ncbi:MAG: FAD-dependent monooxygenase [Sumerlaeia bacterium]
MQSTWENRQTTPWDAIVVGAGVAGAFFAGLAARGGFRVLLLEQNHFPRHKTCGGCLATRGVQLLQQVGALNGFNEFLPVQNAIFKAANGATVHVPFNHQTAQPIAISRSSFDQHLVNWAIEQGTEFADSSQVLSAHQSNAEQPFADETTAGHSRPQQSPTARPNTARRAQTHHLLVRQESKQAVFSTRLLVLADGLGSPLARRLGVQYSSAKAKRIGASWILPEHALTGFSKNTISMHCTRSGYLGIVGLPGSEWNLSASFKAQKPQDFLNRILAEHQIAATPCRELTAPTTVSRPLRQFPNRLGGPGFMLIGDSAGYSEPITGEGMSWAFESAYTAFQAYQHDPRLAPELYEKRIRARRQYRHLAPLLLTQLTARPTTIRVASALQRFSLFPQSLVQRYINSTDQQQTTTSGKRL